MDELLVSLFKVYLYKWHINNLNGNLSALIANKWISSHLATWKYLNHKTRWPLLTYSSIYPFFSGFLHCPPLFFLCFVKQRRENKWVNDPRHENLSWHFSRNSTGNTFSWVAFQTKAIDNNLVGVTDPLAVVTKNPQTETRNFGNISWSRTPGFSDKSYNIYQHGHIIAPENIYCFGFWIVHYPCALPEGFETKHDHELGSLKG